MNKIFAKTLKTSFLGHFRTCFSPPSPTEPFSKTGIRHFFYLMSNFMKKKKSENTDDPEILHLQTDGQT